METNWNRNADATQFVSWIKITPPKRKMVPHSVAVKLYEVVRVGRFKRKEMLGSAQKISGDAR